SNLAASDAARMHAGLPGCGARAVPARGLATRSRRKKSLILAGFCDLLSAVSRPVSRPRLESDPSKLGVLIAYQSHRGDDFPIGKNGIDYIKAAKSEGRCKGAIVLLLRYGSGDGELEFIAAMTIEEVETALRNCRIYDGKWGKFWWLPTPVDSTVP